MNIFRSKVEGWLSGPEGVCQPGGAGQVGEEPIRGKYCYHLTNQRQVLCSQVEGWLSGPEWICQPGGAGQAGEEVDSDHMTNQRQVLLSFDQSEASFIII